MDKTKQKPPAESGGKDQSETFVLKLHSYYSTLETENQYSNCLDDMIQLAHKRGDTAILAALLELAAKWGEDN